ncbi:MAG TPA: phosphatidate cytidylyltransferase [Rhizomicrobium sp.]
MSNPRQQSPIAGNQAPGYRAMRRNMDWVMRPLFGLVLAGLAIWSIFQAPEYFVVLVVLITGLAAYEWHRMVRTGENYIAGTVLTSATAALAVLVLTLMREAWPAMLVVVLGAGVAAVLARSQNQNPLWQALGVIYLGFPALALVALRIFPNRGALVIIGLFLIVWATDTGALIFGKLIGGARMAPKLSPGKTWAGTIGGSVTAAVIFGLYILLLNGIFWGAALFALFFSIFAHAGDLFESFVKRRFGLKNSGSLIPGHGGVLDRMDSTILASIVLALLVFVARFDILFGATS